MAASSQILRSYLVSLGFQVHKPSQNDFDNAIVRGGIKLGVLAKTVEKVVEGAHAMTVGFAKAMESMYYSSRLADTTVSRLQAISYAGRMIGISAENMQGALTAMARNIRQNPGLQGLIESFGIPVKGRTMDQVALDLLGTLKKMPFYIGSQYAGLFGIDPDTYLLLTEGLDKLKQAAAAREDMAKAANLDADAAAKAAIAYTNQLTEIKELYQILKDSAAVAMLPVFKEVAGVVKEVLKDWTLLINAKPRKDTPENSFWRRFGEGLGVVGREGSNWANPNGGGVQLSPDAKRRLASGIALPAIGKAPMGQEAAAQHLSALERTYGLPAGFLDRMWSKESGRGKYMLSPAGAQGHFGFMPKTAAEMGLKDPNDFAQSSTKAAEYMRKLLNKYGGDLQKATAAYNWGMGNVDRKGLAMAPWETRDYVQSLTGQPFTVNQQTTINVTAPDPIAAGTRVADQQERVNADLTRNFQWGVQ